MTGWSGGAANRTWQRGGRAVDGRANALRDVRAILNVFRAEHGWRPGRVWDPRTGRYEPR